MMSYKLGKMLLTFHNFKPSFYKAQSKMFFTRSGMHKI